jgi:hypothetical protein
MDYEIEPRLPRWKGPGKRSPELDALAGATILKIGVPMGAKVEGGGLAIEYCPPDGAPQVIVFGFNDLALWIEDGPRPVGGS